MSAVILSKAAWGSMTRLDKIAYITHAEWLHKAHPYQVPPPMGMDWFIWLLLAGRGSGKTASAAEAFWWWAWSNPKWRLLVLAPTSNDIKHTCFEGASGLLAVTPSALIHSYNKQDHQIILKNGSSIRGISGDSYERLRGPQFHAAWCLRACSEILISDMSTRRIKDIKINDMVMTRYGARKVLACGLSDNPNRIVKITFNGGSLTGTEDHPVLVGDSWVSMGELKKGDSIWQASIMTAKAGGEIQMDTSSIRNTDIYTGTYTRKLMEALKKAMLYITKTTTGQTITCQTLNKCLYQRICSTIASAVQILTNKKQRPHEQYMHVGIKQNIKKVNALTAILHSCQEQCKKLVNFAQTNAEKNGAGQIDETKITLSQIKIINVESLPWEPTYNLTVDGEHEFIANGIVVHNCDELAAFNYLDEGQAWDMMMMGLRLGDTPRIIVTTTPRNKALINELVAREGDDVVIDRASTYANIKNLSKTFSRQLEKYKGSKLYNQEVLGEIIDLEEGKVVSRSMFKLWPHKKEFPKFEYIVQSYDTAFTDKLYNDPTAMTTWGVFKPQDGPMSVMLIDCWAEHLTFPELKPKVIEEFNVVYGVGADAMKPSIILVEAKASGISLIQELQKAFLPVRSWNPGKADKMQRFQISASVFSTGRVWLPESATRSGYVKSWVEGFLSQLCSYPEVTHDDYVDSASMAMRFLADSGWIELNIPPDDYNEDDDDQQKKGNPYAQ